MIRISILGNILEFYYKIEDKWFDLLDWLDVRHVPVYKVVDPIERAGIPSLPVFVALGLIFLYFLSGFLMGGAGISEYHVSLQIVDPDTNACYAYAFINIKNSTGSDIYSTQTNEICPFETTLRGGLYSFDIMPESCNIYNKNLSITGDMTQPMPINIPCTLYLRGQKTLCFEPGVGLGTVYATTRTGLTNVSDPKVCGEDGCTLEIQSGYSYRFDTDSNYYSGSLFLSYDYLDGLDANAGECVPMQEKPSPTPDGEVDILLQSEDGSSVPNKKVEIIRPNSTSVIDYEKTGPTGLAHFEENVGTQFRIRVPAIGNTTWFLSTEVYEFTEQPQFINVTLSFTISTKIKVYEIISDLKVYVPGVFVVSLDDQDVEQVSEFTDANGLVEFGLESGVVYRLTFSKQGYEYTEANITGGQTIEVEIERISEALTGRINVKVLYITEDGEVLYPVDGATLTLYQKIDEIWKKTGYGDSSGWPTTASDGTASFSYVLPGTYCVTASKDEETLCDYDNPIELGPQDVIPVTIFMNPTKHNLYVKVIRVDEVTPARGTSVYLYDSTTNPHRKFGEIDQKDTNPLGEIDPPFSVEHNRDIYLYVEYQDPEETWFTYRTSSVIMDKQKTETIVLIPLDETIVRYVETLDEAQETYDSTVLDSNKIYYFVFSLGIPNTTAGEVWDEVVLEVDDKINYLEFNLELPHDTLTANGDPWWMEVGGGSDSQTIRILSGHKGFPDPGVPISLKVPVKVKGTFEGTVDYYITYLAVWKKGGVEITDPLDIPYKRVDFTLYSGKGPASSYPLHITVLKPDGARAGGATVTIYDVETESAIGTPKNTPSTKGTVEFNIDAGKEIYVHIDYEDIFTHEIYSQDQSPFTINEETWVNYTLIPINNDVKFVKILNDYNDPSSEADLSNLNDDGTYYLVFSLGIENISGSYPTSAELTVEDINSEDRVDFLDGCNINTNPDLSCPQGKSTTSSTSNFDNDETFTINIINKEWRPEIIIPMKVEDVDSRVDNYYLRYEASWTDTVNVKDPADSWYVIYFNITPDDKPVEDDGMVTNYYVRKNGGDKIFVDNNSYPITNPDFEVGDQITIGFNLTWQNRLENFDKTIELVENSGFAKIVSSASSIIQLDYVDDDTTVPLTLHADNHYTFEDQRFELFEYFTPEGLSENDSLIIEIAFSADMPGNDLFALFINGEWNKYYSIEITGTKEIELFSINDDKGMFDLSETIKIVAKDKIFNKINETLSKLVISGDSLASPRCQWPKDDEGGIDILDYTGSSRVNSDNGVYTFELSRNELPVCQLSPGNLNVTHDDPSSVYQPHSNEIDVKSCMKIPGWDDIPNSKAITVVPQEACTIYFAFVDGENTWDYTSSSIDLDCSDGEATIALGVLSNDVCAVTDSNPVTFDSIGASDFGIWDGCTEGVDCTIDRAGSARVDQTSPRLNGYDHVAGVLLFNYTEEIEIGLGGAQVAKPNPWVWVDITALSENEKVEKNYWIPIKLQVRYKEIGGVEEKEYFAPMSLQSYDESYYNCRTNWCTVEQLMKYLSDRETNAGLVSCDSYFPGSTSYTELKLVDSTIDANILQGTMGIVGDSSVTYRVSSNVPDNTKTYFVVDENYLPSSGTNNVAVARSRDPNTDKCSSFLSFTNTRTLPTDITAFQLYLPASIYDEHSYYNTEITGHASGVEKSKELMSVQWGLSDLSPPEEYEGTSGENVLNTKICGSSTSGICSKLEDLYSVIYRDSSIVYFLGKDAENLVEIIQQVINLEKGLGANLIIDRDKDLITLGPTTFGISVSDPTFKLEDHNDLIDDIKRIISYAFGVEDPVLVEAPFGDSTFLLSLCPSLSNCPAEYGGPDGAFLNKWPNMEIPDTGIAWKGWNKKYFFFSDGTTENLKYLVDKIGEDIYSYDYRESNTMTDFYNDFLDNPQEVSTVISIKDRDCSIDMTDEGGSLYYDGSKINNWVDTFDDDRYYFITLKNIGTDTFDIHVSLGNLDDYDNGPKEDDVVKKCGEVAPPPPPITSPSCDSVFIAYSHQKGGPGSDTFSSYRYPADISSDIESIDDSIVKYHTDITVAAFSSNDNEVLDRILVIYGRGEGGSYKKDEIEWVLYGNNGQFIKEGVLDSRDEVMGNYRQFVLSSAAFDSNRNGFLDSIFIVRTVLQSGSITDFDLGYNIFDGDEFDKTNDFTKVDSFYINEGEGTVDTVAFSDDSGEYLSNIFMAYSHNEGGVSSDHFDYIIYDGYEKTISGPHSIRSGTNIIYEFEVDITVSAFSSENDKDYDRVLVAFGHQGSGKTEDDRISYVVYNPKTRIKVKDLTNILRRDWSIYPGRFQVDSAAFDEDGNGYINKVLVASLYDPCDGAFCGSGPNHWRLDYSIVDSAGDLVETRTLIRKDVDSKEFVIEPGETDLRATAFDADEDGTLNSILISYGWQDSSPAWFAGENDRVGYNIYHKSDGIIGHESEAAILSEQNSIYKYEFRMSAACYNSA